MEKVRKDIGAGSTVLDVFFAEVPVEGAIRVSQRFGLGKSKYGLNNWKNGNEWFVIERITHLEAHWHLFKRDGNIDDDNLSAVLWGAYVLCWYETNRPDTYALAMSMIQGRKVYNVRQQGKQGNDIPEKAGKLPIKRSRDRRKVSRTRAILPTTTRKRESGASRGNGNKRLHRDRAIGSASRDNRAGSGTERTAKVGSTNSADQKRSTDKRTGKRQKSRGRGNVRQGNSGNRTGSGGRAARATSKRSARPLNIGSSNVITELDLIKG